MKNEINGIKIGTKKINEIIKNIDLFFKKPKKNVFHITNLNPQIFILAQSDKLLKKIINTSEDILIDGIGIKILAYFNRLKSGEKLAGTDFMSQLINYAAKTKKKVFFLGGFDKVAELTTKYFSKKYPRIKLSFCPGFTDIKNQSKNENNIILNKIIKFKPDFVFVAYGPPYQEKWIYQNREYLKGVVCMGVGGSFNFFANKVPRAPKLIIKLNMEWLWRFIFEPKRFITKFPHYLFFSLFIFKKMVSD